MATSLIPLDTLAGTIKAHIAAGDKAFGKAEEHYKSAGLHLIEARDRVKREGMTFSAFIVSQCGLGRSRAYELIAIADGTKTLEEVRSGANDRKVKHRTNTDRPFRNGQPEEDLIVARQILASNGEQNEIEKLRKQLATANATIGWMKVENEVLRAEANGLTEENKSLRFLVGELMEEIESIHQNEISASVHRYWEEHCPIVEKIGDDAEERRDKAYPMGDDGNDIETDYVEPDRDELVDQLLEDYNRGRFAQSAPVAAKADPPDKAALTALRKRAKALGYKTILRRGDDYCLVNADGERTRGGTGLGLMAQFLDDEEAFQAGAVRVYSTHCGKPVSAHDINGEVALDDPRAVEAFAHLTAEASSALAA